MYVCQVPGTGEVSVHGISCLQASKVPVPAGAGVGGVGVGGVSPQQEESQGREGPWRAVLGIWLCFLQGFQNPLAVWRCAVPTSA